MKNDAKNPLKMTETLAYGYSSESIQWELFNEYQHDMLSKIFATLYFGQN